MSQDILNCQISGNPQEDFQASLSNLTVGEKFYLQCQKPSHISLNIKNILERVPPTNVDNPLDEHLELFLMREGWSRYALKPLHVISFTEEHFVLEVTSYLSGQHESQQGLVLKAADKYFQIKGISWQLDSSLTTSEQTTPQQIEPHPNYGFSKIPLPYVELVFWISLILASFVCLFLFWKKRQKQKKEFDDIENLKTSRDPIYEFHYRARRLEKKYLGLPDSAKSKKTFVSHTQLCAFTKQLNQTFKTFLAMQLEFPAHLWPSRKSFLYLKKRHFPPDLRDRIFAMLSELDEAEKDQISQAQCHQNLSLCKNLADQVIQDEKRRQA